MKTILLAFPLSLGCFAKFAFPFATFLTLPDWKVVISIETNFIGRMFCFSTDSRCCDPSEGRPKALSAPEIVAEIQDMVLNDRRIAVRHLVEVLNISLGTVSNILCQVLGFKNLCAAFANNATKTHSNTKDCVRHFITMDETWVYHHDTESKKRLRSGVNPALGSEASSYPEIGQEG